MKNMRWALIGLLLAVSLAQSQAVYNYFPPPGITYTTAGGMALGSTTAQGAGTFNAQGLYINGVPVGTGSGSVTSVSVVTANGLSGTVASPATTPAITLSPTFTGIVYSTGSAFQAAVATNFPVLNQNTTGNAATATLAATATAAASAPTPCGSGQAAQGINASFNAIGCITPFSVVNESANTVFSGPASGTAALPAFRPLVPADLPLSTPMTFSGANTFTADNTFTGATTMTPSAGVGLAVNGNASNDAIDITNGAGHYSQITGSSTAGSSFGLHVVAGTNSSDVAFRVTNRAGTSNYFSVGGDGSVSITDSAGGGPYQVGYLGTPLNSQSLPYTLLPSDRGKTVELSGSSGTVTIPSGVFSAGDVVTILAFSGTTAYTIAPAGGVTLYWAIGNLTTGSRTLTSVGLATILCVNSTTFVISGSGIT